jgi:hypothetical protein
MNRKQRRATGKSRQASPSGTAGQANPLELHAQGVQAFQAGRADIAADLMAQAIAAGGATPDLHYNLAIALKAPGRLREAAASY